MIAIPCIRCQTVLEIDDAFAGGACRCQQCGTIQTVPADAPKAGAAPPARTQSPPAKRVMPPKKSAMLPLLIGGGAGAVLLLVVLIWWASRPGDTTQPTATPPPAQTRRETTLSSDTPAQPAPAPRPKPVVPRSPHYLGIDLSASQSVAYVLDRGSATGQSVDALKAATYQSIRSLPQGARFAVIFWDTETSQGTSYPPLGLAPASPESIDEARKAFEYVIGFGRTDAEPALKDAAARKPTDVILVTAKADDLPESLVATIDQLFTGGVRVHAVALGEDYGESLKTIPSRHRGVYKVISHDELRTFAESE